MHVLHALLQFVAAVEDGQQLTMGNYMSVSFIDEDDVFSHHAFRIELYSNTLAACGAYELL